MKILVVKPSSLGDVIHSLPFLNALKKTFPDCRIDWVISRNLKGILEDNPFVNQLISIDKDSWKNPLKLIDTLSEFLSLRKKLKSSSYDVVVDLQGLLRSGLITFFSNSPLKVGFSTSREGSRLAYNKIVTVNGTVHAVDRYLKAAESIGARTDSIEFPLHINERVRDKTERLLQGKDKYVLIAPSSRWKTKNWPIDNFISLINKVSLPCVITGSKNDFAIGQKISDSSSGNTVNLCGKTDLKNLIALIEGASAVVTNDSGPMHIAKAMNVPIVALFGPTDPEKTGPYGWKGNNTIRVITADVPCRPCFKRKCTDPLCMQDISVDTVYGALKELL